jgi:hypothetical protein
MTTLLLVSILASGAAPVPADTVRLEVGSPEVNGRVYQPHTAPVRVHIGSTDAPVVAEWTNELTLGDSAGRPIMRWVTRGMRKGADGTPVEWEILQTYDHVTLAPYGYVSTSSTGGETRLAIDGRRVKGTRRVHRDSTVQTIDKMVDRMGFIASASDLVPLAAGMKPGMVMTAPVWGPNMPMAETRIFTVIGKEPTPVEGQQWNAWKVEERRASDRTLLAIWYLVDESPYMVAGDVVLPDGRVQKMTEVAIR